MNFKVWLVENATWNAYSWLDTSGKFFPIINEKSHKKKASEITNNPSNHEAMDELFRKGWQRVLFIGENLICNNPYKKPNSIQISALKEYAMTENFESLIYDYDRGDRTLWQNKN